MAKRSVTARIWALTPKISWMTMMAPRGRPSGSARQARIGLAPSGFSSIQWPMSLSRFERSTRAARAPLRNCDAADDQRQRDDMIGCEGLAEQRHRHDRAEHGHQIDEHPRSPRPDQLDPAHVKNLRRERGAERHEGERQESRPGRPDEA